MTECMADAPCSDPNIWYRLHLLILPLTTQKPPSRLALRPAFIPLTCARIARDGCHRTDPRRRDQRTHDKYDYLQRLMQHQVMNVFVLGQRGGFLDGSSSRVDGR